MRLVRRGLYLCKNDVVAGVASNPIVIHEGVVVRLDDISSDLVGVIFPSHLEFTDPASTYKGMRMKDFLENFRLLNED